MKKSLIILSLLLFFGTNCFASALGGYDAGSLNSQYMRDLRLHEAVTRERSKNAIVKQNKPVEEQQKNLENVNITSIKFVNNRAVPTSKLQEITAFALNKPASDNNIAVMRNLVAKYYQSNGYYSVLVIPVVTNLPNGEIIYEIREGTKNSVTVE